MKVILTVIESYYQNSLALDYLRVFALADPDIRAYVEIEVRVFPPGADETSILAELLGAGPQIVGFCTYLWNVEKTYTVAAALRRENPDLLIVLGGLEVSYDAPDVLRQKPFINAVVQGEGEIPFREILRTFLRERRLREGLPGVWCRENDTIFRPGPLAIVQNLDDIPSPFASIDFSPATLTGDVLYESYRGCVFNCAFCLYHRNYTKQRYFSIERVERDLSILLASPCKQIRFVDSTFNIHLRRTKQILRFLEGTDKWVSVEVSAEFFDEETIKLLPRAGIRQVDVGLQSVKQEALDAVNRKFFKEEPFTRNLALLRDHPEIALNVELIAGLPGDNYESVKRSLHFAIRQRPAHISMYRLLLLKGSEVRRRAAEFGMKFDPLPPYTLLASREFEASDLDRLELIYFSHIVLYNAGVATWALRAAVERYGIEPWEVYENFLSFCVDIRYYTEAEIRELAHWYAVGNRFDQPRPSNFSLERVREVTRDFFQWLAAAHGDEGFQTVYEELIDYGYRLARLDLVTPAVATAKPLAGCSVRKPKVSRFADLRSYSPHFFQTMVDMGQWGDQPPTEASAIAFFLQPRVGPTALVLNDGEYWMLRQCDGQHDVDEIPSLLADCGFVLNPDAHRAVRKTIHDLTTLGLLEEAA